MTSGVFFCYGVNDNGAEGDVGDEIAVHDVAVDPVSTCIFRYFKGLT